MSMKVAHLAQLVDQTAGLAKPSQATPEGTELASAQDVQQSAQIASGMTAQDAELRAQHAQRFAVNPFGQINDGSLHHPKVGQRVPPASTLAPFG